MTNDQSPANPNPPHESAPIVTPPEPPASASTTQTQTAHANMRKKSDFSRAKRHSHLVSTLRVALPMMAIAWALVFSFNATFSLANLPDIAVDSAGIEGGKLVMNAPIMTGFDKQNRPFDVTADRAIQDLTDSSIVDLENLNALLPMDDKTKARVLADYGRYNTEKETMVLRDNIVIKGARGMDIKMKSADIDMKSGAMQSNEAVSVISKDMTINADSVTVENNGDRIVFKKRVVTIIQPKAASPSTIKTKATQ